MTCSNAPKCYFCGGNHKVTARSCTVYRQALKKHEEYREGEVTLIAHNQFLRSLNPRKRSGPSSAAPAVQSCPSTPRRSSRAVTTGLTYADVASPNRFAALQDQMDDVVAPHADDDPDIPVLQQELGVSLLPTSSVEVVIHRRPTPPSPRSRVATATPPRVALRGSRRVLKPHASESVESAPPSRPHLPRVTRREPDGRTPPTFNNDDPSKGFSSSSISPDDMPQQSHQDSFTQILSDIWELVQKGISFKDICFRMLPRLFSLLMSS